MEVLGFKTVDNLEQELELLTKDVEQGVICMIYKD